jgi:ATP-dependent DNA helicase DinG
MLSLEEVFEPAGVLAERLPGFTYRDAQRQMAELVRDALVSRRHLAVEAGTGIGKTFAYLMPVLLSGRKAIISTGTRTLQDQLFARDLPTLGEIVGRPVDVALLKGRNNYLCRHRLELARGSVRQPGVQAGLAAVAAWSRVSADGDLTELEDFAEDNALRGWVTSTADNCLGVRCEHHEDCFLLRARRRAQAADVVVVNHHLLLADLSLKETGFGDLLPGADAVIVDEAHQLPDVAQQFFGTALSSRELELLARDVTAEARAAGGLVGLEALSDALRKRVDDSRLFVGDRLGRMPWHSCADGLGATLKAWREGLADLASTLEAERESSAGLGRCGERCQSALERLTVLENGGDGDGLRWIEASARGFVLHWTPLDAGRELGERIRAQGGTWIFASATLAVGDDFSHFLGRAGVGEAVTRVLPSPFDYAGNAALYLPPGLPDPSREEYTQSLLEEVWPLLDATAGGAFLLFTSYRALHTARDWLERRRLPGPLLVQGSGPRTALLQRFREAGDALLLGTSSFWQGVDVRGQALRAIVIDRLPFASPGDPLVQARINAIRGEGGDPFVEFQLPQAVLALKQGVGRLIRDFEDRGLIVIGDPRLRTRPYGRVFLSSLPPMRRIDEVSEALSFAAGLCPPGDGRALAGR